MKVSRIFAILFFLVQGQALPAQKFFHASVGYNFATTGAYVGNSLVYDASNSIISVKDHYFNPSRGIMLNAGVQFPVFLGFDVRLGGEICLTSELEVKEEYPEPRRPESITYSGNINNIHALLILSARQKRVRPYVGVGMGIFWGNMESEEIASGRSFEWLPSFNETVEYIQGIEYEFHPSLGMLGILGIEYPLQKNIKFFLEGGFQQTSFTLANFTVNKAIANNANVLPQLDVDSSVSGNQKVVEYQKNSTTLEAPPVYPAANAGVKFGVRFNF